MYCISCSRVYYKDIITSQLSYFTDKVLPSMLIHITKCKVLVIFQQLKFFYLYNFPDILPPRSLSPQPLAKHSHVLMNLLWRPNFPCPLWETKTIRPCSTCHWYPPPPPMVWCGTSSSRVSRWAPIWWPLLCVTLIPSQIRPKLVLM